MPIVSAPEEFTEENLFVDLRRVVGAPLYLKCEGFNFAGSVKQKVAAAMIDAAEERGLLLNEDSVLVESSSGNLGVALSMIAASRGYRFQCVTDSRCNVATRQLMEAYGARVHVITEPGPEGDLLAARTAYVRQLCERGAKYVWLNQYINDANWRAHYRFTAPAIARQFPDLDVLFVGAGTTGTLMGCARWFRHHRAEVRIVAIDSVGSVVFGGDPGVRRIPGLGSGIRPPMLDESLVDEVVHVAEPETIRMCRRLLARGFMFGGSTGTVVGGAVEWLGRLEEGALTAVAIAPDLGDRYLNTVYQDSWVRSAYGDDVLDWRALVDSTWTG